MNLEQQLRASVDDARDVDLVAAYRNTVAASPLADPPALTIPHTDAARLVTLGEEALRLRRKITAPVQTGPHGRLVAVIDGDDRNRLVALIEFDDEDALRAAGAMIAADVSIELDFKTPKPANETLPGQNGAEEEDDK